MEIFRVLGPVVIVLFFGASLLLTRRARARIEADNPQLRVEAIAQALGLRLVRGDPQYNLGLGTGPGRFGILRDFYYRVDVAMEGTHRGHPVSFHVLEKFLRIRLRYGVKLYESHSFDSELRLGDVRPASPFEAYCAPKGSYDFLQPSGGLPVADRGVAEDFEHPAEWWVCTSSPELAGTVRAWLRDLNRDCGQHCALHVVGDERGIAFVVSQLQMMSTGPLLATIEDALADLAPRVEAPSS